MITLAIETSCDETAAAIIKDGRDVISNVVSSQAEVHRLYGGVVPEIASRHHLEQINYIIECALTEAGLGVSEVDLIGVTEGPGLVGALLVGLATAKAIAFAMKKPIVGVNHIWAHVSANYIVHRELKPPFMGIIVSGGHTNIVKVKGYNDIQVLGRTRDDAAGEAFDKVARVLGLDYPGGPAVDAAAKHGDPGAIAFKRVLLEKDSFDFSFSGLKTGVLNYLNTEKQAGRSINISDVAASFQQAVVDVIVTKALSAARIYGEEKLVMAGGVAANSVLRKALGQACKDNGVALYYPTLELCTDNAAMIGVAAYYKFLEFGEDALDLDALPNLKN